MQIVIKNDPDSDDPDAFDVEVDGRHLGTIWEVADTFRGGFRYQFGHGASAEDWSTLPKATLSLVASWGYPVAAPESK